MMWLEIVASLLVGVALTALVVGPLVQARPVSPLVDDEPEELEFTEKGIALSALKEIEFDRATGKLSEEDYEFLKAKYTAQALAALRSEDVPVAAGAAAPAAGADIESLIAARARAIRGAATAGAPTCPSCGPRPEADALFCSDCGARVVEGACGQCGAVLEAGSRFCDRCGSRAAA